MRKDATASESFVRHNLAIGHVAADLTRIYYDATRLILFTKNELLREDANNNDGSDDYEPASASFPQPLPDMLIDLMGNDDSWEDYILTAWHDTVPFWVYRKRIKITSSMWTETNVRKRLSAIRRQYCSYVTRSPYRDGYSDI